MSWLFWGFVALVAGGTTVWAFSRADFWIDLVKSFFVRGVLPNLTPRDMTEAEKQDIREGDTVPVEVKHKTKEDSGR